MAHNRKIRGLVLILTLMLLAAFSPVSVFADTYEVYDFFGADDEEYFDIELNPVLNGPEENVPLYSYSAWWESPYTDDGTPKANEIYETADISLYATDEVVTLTNYSENPIHIAVFIYKLYDKAIGGSGEILHNIYFSDHHNYRLQSDGSWTEYSNTDWGKGVTLRKEESISFTFPGNAGDILDLMLLGANSYKRSVVQGGTGSYGEQADLIIKKLDGKTVSVSEPASPEAADKSSSGSASGEFTDVEFDDNFYVAVVWGVERGITSGTSATTFSPYTTCTRAQIMTFLWRYCGCPEPKGNDNPFTDVKEKDYFYKPVLWAVENGITDGTSATTFSPNMTCENRHILTFIWNYMGKPGEGGNPSIWYADALAYAESHGLYYEVEKESADPTGACTRATALVYLYNLDTNSSLVSAAKKWADKNGKTFANDDEMVSEFRNDTDAYVEYIINK